ncbi:MAG: peptidyl-tRNA hydrolase [Epulopiscium sp. Nele67-Bin002]|nr:MAG: aminoacyl-tRNA hydrolase [Epulopiscium sp. Nuni2H_MBin001]OON91224.1 MAG: peptidyl-tRNA hydrolase [Epulopiscium sp. Nele67-Bin002]OON91737.1 MAG: aminoacyl-tRNA hydrolase [Epulopiscium sp. Nele67-Bin001]
MKLIIGLGNPGLKYLGTRHNVGFDAVDYIAHHADIRIDKNKFKSHIGEGKIGNEQVIFMKPQTYMNLSGEAVIACMNFYKLQPENIIVIYDDVSFDVAVTKIKKTGSAGGHNGIKNIIEHLGTKEFPRIKIGVGQKPPGWDLADYVLGKFTKQEMTDLKNEMPYIKDFINNFVIYGLDTAMNKYALSR